MSDDTYFANLPPEEFASALQERIDDYYDEIDSNGRLALWRRVHRYYYGLDESGIHEASRLKKGGEQGELTLLKANHFRNLLQHLLVLITQQKPAYDCRAVNTDYKSQVQTILGNNILEYYLRENFLGDTFRTAAEIALVYSEAYVELRWDKNSGEDVRPDLNGGMVRAGDVKEYVYEPLNVVRETRGNNRHKQSWYSLRRWENRFDLAMEHPEQGEELLSFDDSHADDKYYNYGFSMSRAEGIADDMIPVHYFYHDKTPACPTGRVAKVVGDLVLEFKDFGDLKEMPVYPMVVSKQHGTTFGYTVAFDLLAVQEGIDLLYSTVMSNQATFGVQNIWMKPGSQLVPHQLAGGLNVLESEEKPEAINLTQTPAEIMTFLKQLESLGQVLSGVNSVARGQPEASLKSGAALALIASQAVQFSNGLQAAYAQLLESVGSGLLRILQKKANIPRLAVIAGKDNRTEIKEFVGDDISDINRVIVDLGNPVSRTVAGRIQMATDMLQQGAIKSPADYIQVIETGRADPIVDDARAEELLIDAENERLQEGTPTPVIAIDKHLKHIDGHRKVLADPKDREDPKIVAAATQHIQDHINALRTTDPALLNALGQAPIQVMPNGAPATGPQGANAPQPNKDTPPGEQVPAAEGAPAEVAENMPNMPESPQ